MRLEDVAVVLRPRRSWEAVDLGHSMVRRWWRAVYLPWLLVLVPAAALALGLLGPWGLLVLWWLKPVWDRIPLHVLSRAVFGAPPRAGQTLRALPRLLTGSLPSALVLLRFDPARAFRLPVWQLERLRGRARQLRSAQLAAGAGEAAAWLSLASLAFELGLALALLTAIPLLTPSWIGIDWELIGERLVAGTAPFWARAALFGAPLLSFLLLEPFHVAAGFGLYLNRRTRLEGWDIEIAFRRLASRAAALEAQRAETRQRGRTTQAAGALGLLTLAGGLSLALAFAARPAAASAPAGAALEGSPSATDATEATLQADEADELDGAASSPWSRWDDAEGEDPRETVKTLLSGEAFQRQSPVQGRRLREDLFGDREPAARPDVPAWVEKFGLLLKVLLVVVLAALLVLVLVLARSAIVSRRRRREAEIRGPLRSVLGLDIRPESLPEDVARSSEELWRRGEQAAALSLLYRAALARLVERDRVVLAESFTEEDCLRSARPRLSAARAGYFARLTRGWQRTAYAHRPPAEAEASALWAGWREHFPEAA